MQGPDGIDPSDEVARSNGIERPDGVKRANGIERPDGGERAERSDRFESTEPIDSIDPMRWVQAALAVEFQDGNAVAAVVGISRAYASNPRKGCEVGADGLAQDAGAMAVQDEHGAA